MSSTAIWWLLRLLIALTIAFGTAPARCADVYVHRGQVMIDGQIQRGDLKKLARVALSDLDSFLNAINLNSNGGDVSEAIQISTVLRESFAQTFVRKEQYCASACFIIWAGGVARSNSGTLGVHRLSISSQDGDLRSWERAVAPASQAVAEHLRSMGMPEKIIAKMQETPVSTIFIISQRWLISEDLDTKILDQPAFLDVAERQCGRQPAYLAMTTGTSVSRSALDKWHTCADDLRRDNQSRNISAITELLKRAAGSK